ncbi:MAG TPA: tetratricopeptide repeat protein, partial [Acidobacteriaceae bacterium]|nr:tetratricopeptide repeat protein [Acidobacteriaceae bacterium]
GRVNEAEQDLSHALHFRPDSAEAHFLLSMVHQSRGATLNQRQELGEVLRLRPGYLEARLQLARVLLASGAAQSALDVLTVLPDNQKNNLAILTQKNWAFIALKQLPAARKGVDDALKAVRHPDLLLQDAFLKMADKDYKGARASLTEALTKSPEDLRALRLMVGTYNAEKQPAAAVQVVQNYAAQHPKSAPIQELLAELFMSNGQKPQAREALMAAKKANPGFVTADLSLAGLDAEEGHFKEALKTLSDVLARSPNNAAAQLLLAAVDEKSGNHTAADAAYRKVLQLDPSNIRALNNLAYNLAEYDNQSDEALQYAQKASELAPDTPAVENTLGWVLYKKGLYSMALSHLEKAADKEPSARRKAHVAMAYLRMGDQDQGQKNLNAALKLDPSIPEIQAAQQMLYEAERR